MNQESKRLQQLLADADTSLQRATLATMGTRDEKMHLAVMDAQICVSHLCQMAGDSAHPVPVHDAEHLRIDVARLSAESEDWMIALDDLGWPARRAEPAELDALERAARTAYARSVVMQIRSLQVAA